MEENVKIAKIKKSCKVGKTVSHILFIILLIGAIACAAASVTCFSMGKDFDIQMQKAADAGYISTDNDLAAAKWIDINLGDPTSLHSDIPALQEAIDDHPYSIMYGTVCLVLSITCAVGAVLMKMLSNVFKLIMEEDSPFTDKVIKRVTIVLIVASVIGFLTSGAALGAIGLITAWVVHTILDYGKTLQIQSDETL